MERALARLVDVEVIFLKGEQRATVLPRKPKLGRREAAAKAIVVALDETDHVALGIGRGEVDGIAGTDLPGRKGF